MKNINFALLGAAGYVAPKHMDAIKANNANLSCALDPKDSVGILDSYFPEAHFFVEFERFERHISKLQKSSTPLDYLSICTPNYLHDSHIRFGLQNQMDVICEKPLVLNPWNIQDLIACEKNSAKKVYNILQLRLHPDIIALKNRVEKTLKENPNKRFVLDLTYITSRGKWYFVSWKGDESKSGGIATNIGIHFFDMLQFIFGMPKNPSNYGKVHLRKEDVASGILELEHADIRWFLSINANHLPQIAKENNKRMYRSINFEGEEIEFSSGFENLHKKSYEEILQNRGFGLTQAEAGVILTHQIRTSQLSQLNTEYHPYIKKLSLC